MSKQIYASADKEMREIISNLLEMLKWCLLFIDNK
jgi:hypothetical protein